MPARRAMSSHHASEVKTAGHLNEQHFANLIGGEVQKGGVTDKKDVIDIRHGAHSVKAGTWWQIFLYTRERFLTNTIMQRIGEVSALMVACIDALPEQYEDYLIRKTFAKMALQPAMRRLKDELRKPNIFRAFLDKSLFNGGEATYLSVYPGPSKNKEKEKHFHIFHKDDVVNALARDIDVRNSIARSDDQYSDQKVILYSRQMQKNIGEIEIRTDSAGHYRRMKCRLNSPAVMKILQLAMSASTQLNQQITVHGRARQTFRLK